MVHVVIAAFLSCPPVVPITLYCSATGLMRGMDSLGKIVDQESNREDLLKKVRIV